MFRLMLLAGAIIAPSAASAAPPAKFLVDAIQGDNSETRLGQLIATKGSDPAVRRFGSTLVSDHTRARAQAANVARQMHVPIPNSPMPEAVSEHRKLERMSGHAFDREVKRYMIDDHQKDIAKFDEQARGGDQRTASLARAQLPVLRKHLQMAQSLPR